MGVNHEHDRVVAARFASGDDVARIIEILAEMHRESRYRERQLETSKLQALVRGLIDHKDGACIVVQEGGEIVGAALGFLTEFYFSHERVASELLLYVLPAHRGSLATTCLGNRFIEWGKAAGAVEIQAGVTAQIADEQAERFYLRLGFSHLGRSFVKALGHVRT